MDALIVIVIVASFALLVTAHVAVAAGLLGRKPRLRAVAAFLVPPLAPYFGIREGMWGRSVLWLVALTAYVVARIAAR